MNLHIIYINFTFKLVPSFHSLLMFMIFNFYDEGSHGRIKFAQICVNLCSTQGPVSRHEYFKQDIDFLKHIF